MQTTTLNFLPFNRETETALAPKKLHIAMHPTSYYTYFNNDVLEQMDAELDDYIEFLKFGADWFIVKSTPCFGYRLYSNADRRQNGLRVSCGRLIKSFFLAHGIRQKTALKIGVKKTGHFYNGQPVFELMRPHESKYHTSVNLKR